MGRERNFPRVCGAVDTAHFDVNLYFHDTCIDYSLATRRRVVIFGWFVGSPKHTLRGGSIMLHWLMHKMGNLLGSSPKRRLALKHRTPRRTILRLEEMEPRVVPTAVTVSDLGDNGGTNQLRAKIDLINGSTDTTNTIDITVAGTITLRSQLPPITKTVTISDSAGNLIITRDATRGNFGIFVIDDNGNATITGIEITGGYTDGLRNGGAILKNGQLTLNSDTIHNNECRNYGGAIDNESDATLNLFTCTLYQNVSDGNGGGAIYNNGTLNISGSSIYSNRAAEGFGGGIYNDTSGSVAIVSTSITSNNAVDGGGIFNKGAFSMSGGSLEYNTAGTGNGGGLWAKANTSLTDVTISGNSANNNVGGFYVNGGTVSLTDCVLSGNTATNQGNGGAYKAPGTYTASGGTISDNIVPV
jgi:hypothetical protein